MSRLVFDGHAHELVLVSSEGKTLGTWSAYNNVDSHAKLSHLGNGTYSIIDRPHPYTHSGDGADGPYGSYGIIRFKYPDHPGIGVHSGREHHKHRPGPKHPTMGCIRTTDTAMKAISEHMAADNLLTIEIRNNSRLSHHGAKAKNHARHAHHKHEGHPHPEHESHSHNLHNQHLHKPRPHGHGGSGSTHGGHHRPR